MARPKNLYDLSKEHHDLRGLESKIKGMEELLKTELRPETQSRIRTIIKGYEEDLTLWKELLK